MRSVDLAVYAGSLAAEAAALAARVERARRRLREAALEHEARLALSPDTVARLQALGLLGAPGGAAELVEIASAQADLAAVEKLQAWVEARLYEARDASGAPAVLSPVSSAAR